MAPPRRNKVGCVYLQPMMFARRTIDGLTVTGVRKAQQWQWLIEAALIIEAPDVRISILATA